MRKNILTDNKNGTFFIKTKTMIHIETPILKPVLKNTQHWPVFRVIITRVGAGTRRGPWFVQPPPLLQPFQHGGRLVVRVLCVRMRSGCRATALCCGGGGRTARTRLRSWQFMIWLVTYLSKYKQYRYFLLLYLNKYFIPHTWNYCILNFSLVSKRQKQ